MCVSPDIQPICRDGCGITETATRPRSATANHVTTFWFFQGWLWFHIRLMFFFKFLFTFKHLKKIIYFFKKNTTKTFNVFYFFRKSFMSEQWTLKSIGSIAYLSCSYLYPPSWNHFLSLNWNGAKKTQKKFFSSEYSKKMFKIFFSHNPNS